MLPATSTLLLALAIFLHAPPADAAHHMRTRAIESSLVEPARASSEAWKFGVLGLAGLSFLIRRRVLELA